MSLFLLELSKLIKEGCTDQHRVNVLTQYLKPTGKMQCMLTFTLSELRSALKSENLICIVCVETSSVSAVKSNQYTSDVWFLNLTCEACQINER